MASKKATVGHKELMAMRKLTRASRVPGFTPITSTGSKGSKQIKVWAKESARPDTQSTMSHKEMRRKHRVTVNPELQTESILHAVS